MSEVDLYIYRCSSWCQKRARLEKFSFLGLLLMIVILLITILSIKYRKTLPDLEIQTTCSAPFCYKSAARVLEKMDFNIDPCEDFYKFTCGNYINKTIVPPSRTSVSFFTNLSDTINEQLRTVLEKPIELTDAKFAMLAKSLYKACMNTTEIESSSLSYMKNIFKEAGGWPVINGENWKEDSTNWTATSYQFMKLGFYPNMLFQLSVSYGNEKFPRRFLVDQPVPLTKIVRDKESSRVFIKTFYKYMVKVAIAFGANETRAYNEMKQVLDLDIAITNITLTKEKRATLLQGHPVTIRYLEKNYPFVPWLEYINVLLEPVSKVMTLDDGVTITYPTYFKELESILNSVPKRTLINFMYWKVVNSFAHYLDDNIREILLEFYTSVYGITERDDRWKGCILVVKDRLPLATGGLYVQNFFSKEAKNAILELVTHIKEQFEDTLRTVDWIDDITRYYALEKAKAIKMRVGYPDEMLDYQKVDKLYKNLTLDGSNYVASIQNLSIFYMNRLLATLGKPFDKTKAWWQYGNVAITNAFYNRIDNTIYFPAGILQDLTFDHRRPQYMNYGAIGFMIGHEITHGFDDFGRRYNKNGLLSNWWQPSTSSAFHAKALCIIDQYGNIEVPELNNIKINGNYSHNENIADNGGVKTAYLAYKTWVNKHGPEPTLPGLPYTPEQMFWISAGTTWCEVETKQQFKIMITDRSHLPHAYRINVPLMNSEYFARDFNCPKGSRMNPVHKCSVW